MRNEKSRSLRYRAEAVIAHGALTNSKRPQSFVEGVYPTHLARGIGAEVWDVDGNKYVDFICGMGAHLFGYRNQEIDDAVARQIRQGTIFSLGTELEVEVAEALTSKFCQIEQLRFLKTASEACSAAVRIARAFTGKHYVISSGYHGWHDEFTGLTPPATGVPPSHFMQPFPEAGFVPVASGPRNLVANTAALIVEPVIVDASEERLRYLRELVSACRRENILIVFDETITGLRFPSLSVAKHIGVSPDLTVMGKAIGGGYPLALVGGRRAVMSCDYFVSSTFAGDCIALAAAKAALKLINEPGTVDDLHRTANRFCEQFNSIAPELVRIEGYGTRGAFIGDDMNKALFMQECVKAGILFGPSFFYGTTHHHHDDFVLSTAKAVFNRMRTGQVRLEGKVPQKPYAQKARE